MSSSVVGFQRRPKSISISGIVLNGYCFQHSTIRGPAGHDGSGFSVVIHNCLFSLTTTNDVIYIEIGLVLSEMILQDSIKGELVAPKGTTLKRYHTELAEWVSWVSQPEEASEVSIISV